MTGQPEAQPRLLALCPGSRGLGFVVLEGESRLVDWGTRGLAGNEAVVRAALYAFIDRYRPHVLVCERSFGSATRKGERARNILHIAENIAKERRIVLRQYSRRQLENVFAEWQAVTKAQRATLLAERFPTLAPYLPPPPRPWVCADRRIMMFDALSFAVTHLVIAAKVEDTLRTIPF